MMTWLRKLFKRAPRTVTGETKEEFLASVERHNKMLRDESARANASMQAKYEKQWVAQYDRERGGLR
jgi:hypothetical protein